MSTEPTEATEPAKPMLIAIIKHDVQHPVFDPTNAPFRMNWLAFNPRTRRVLIEVEADTPEGLQAFRAHYRIGLANPDGVERGDHSLTGDPSEWRALQGEADAGDDPADPMKHVKQSQRMRRRLREEAERRRLRREALERMREAATETIPRCANCPHREARHTGVGGRCTGFVGVEQTEPCACLQYVPRTNGNGEAPTTEETQPVIEAPELPAPIPTDPTNIL